MPEKGFSCRLTSGLLMLALLVTSAGTQSASTGETPAQYDVEIIVFRNLSGQTDGEQWPHAGDAPADPAGHFRAEDAPTDLPESGYRMQRIADSLNRSGAYRVVAHKAWRQTARDRAQAAPFPVNATGDELDGTVTLVRERFLHLNVDLVLQSTYSLDEKRRLRSGERHYFDHPMFGVIAEVNPYVPPEPATPASETAPLAQDPGNGETAGPAAETPVPVPGHRVRQAPY
jgi:hypothetical protein